MYELACRTTLLLMLGVPFNAVLNVHQFITVHVDLTATCVEHCGIITSTIVILMFVLYCLIFIFKHMLENLENWFLKEDLNHLSGFKKVFSSN